MYRAHRSSVYLKKCLTIAAFVTALTGIDVVQAQSLVITDCQGFTRAAKKVDAGSQSDVEIEVDSASGQGAPQDLTATLTNQVNHEVLTSKVSNGKADFIAVPPGVYALEISQPDRVVGLITINSTVGFGVAAAAVGGAAVVGGAAAGGVVAIAREIDNNGGGDEGAPAPAPPPTTIPTIAPTPTSRPRPTSTPSDCPQCEPGKVPPPIKSPFPPEELPAHAKSYTGNPPPQAAAKRLSPYD